MGPKSRAVKFYSTVSDRSEVVHLISALFSKDGGPGSGNFNHSGRPGKVGGSAPENGSAGSSESNQKSASKSAESSKKASTSAKSASSKPKKGHFDDIFDKMRENRAEYKRLTHEDDKKIKESQELFEKIKEEENKGHDYNKILKLREQYQKVRDEEAEIYSRRTELDSELESFKFAIKKRGREEAKALVDMAETEEQLDFIQNVAIKDLEKARQELSQIGQKRREALRKLTNSQNKEEQEKAAEEYLKLDEEYEMAEAELSRIRLIEEAADFKRAQFAEEKDDQEFQASGLSREDFRRKKAVEEFGLTTDYHEAGWMLADGSLLDFDGSNDESRGEREHDHRDIARIFPTGEEYGTEEMQQFRNDGNIRVYPEIPGINLCSGREPTPEQYAALRMMLLEIEENEGQFCVDFSSSYGDMYGQLAYSVNPEGEEPHTQPFDVDEIIRDIQEHYRTGEITEEFGRPTFSHDSQGVLNDGGEGSGNFNHAGRPGLVGGSAPEGGSSSYGKNRPKSTSDMVSMVAGSSNYTNGKVHKTTLEQLKEARAKREKASKEFLKAHEELDDASKNDPDFDIGSIPDRPKSRFSSVERSLTYALFSEKGKELQKKVDEKRKELKDAEEEEGFYRQRILSERMDQSKKQKAKFNPKPLKPTQKKDFPGFKLEADTTKGREALENGAVIVEMSPKEYLERCAYQIFDGATLESTTSGVDPEVAGQYADKMESGDEFPLPYLDFDTKNQEGRHRAVAAMMNGVKTIPVEIIGTPPDGFEENEPKSVLREGEELTEIPAGEFDIFELMSQQASKSPEELEKERQEEEARQKEQEERESYGQNGLTESEYPEELRLTEEERDHVNNIYRKYKDDSYRGNVNRDVMDALSGYPPEHFDDLEKHYTEQLEEATEMIAKRKEEGYSFGDYSKGTTSLERKKAWWDFYNEHGYAPEAAVGKNGIKYWQTQRKQSLEALSAIKLAKKIAKRREFAEKTDKFVEWRKSPRANDPSYKPWQKDMAMDGGPGSGNFNHAGRPGEVGGSAPEGGASSGSTEATSLKAHRTFSGIKKIANRSNTYQSFKSSLSREQKDAIAQQHKVSGSKEDLETYSERLFQVMTSESAHESKQAQKVVQGKDISADYSYNGESYVNPENGQVIDTAIEDVIHKQGFDGVPRVVSKEEMDKITEEHPEMPILFRAYTAPSKKAIEQYDEMLEGGEWYVDCGVGGAQYGQGMYCAGVYRADPDERVLSWNDPDLEVRLQDVIVFRGPHDQGYKGKQVHAEENGDLWVGTLYMVTGRDGKDRKLIRMDEDSGIWEDVSNGGILEETEVDELLRDKVVFECEPISTDQYDQREREDYDRRLQGAEREMDHYIAEGIERIEVEDDLPHPPGKRAALELTSETLYYFDEKELKEVSDALPEEGSLVAITPKNGAHAYVYRYEGGQFVPSDGVGPKLSIEVVKNTRKWAPIEGKDEDFAPTGRVRRMTLDPSAKIITHRELVEIRNRANEIRTESRFQRKKEAEEFLKNMPKAARILLKVSFGEDITEEEKAEGLEAVRNDPSLRHKVHEFAIGAVEREKKRNEEAKKWDRFSEEDLGVIATMLGYDAINAEGHGLSDSYTVVLNRTKLILQKEAV